MIRNFFRHLGESLKSLKRNGWMSLASVSSVTVTLILVGIFLAVIFNVRSLAIQIENDVRVKVLVETGTKQADIDTLEDELNGLSNVTKVEFSSAADELKAVQETYGNSFSLFDGDSNPLYDAFFVSASSPENVKKVQKAAEKLDNVYKADYGGLPSEKIFAISKAVQTWGLGAAVLLLVVAIFLISNTIRITIISRSREIQIMRLVGAKNGYIRGPFYFEGAWIGILGSIIPIVLMIFSYTKVFTNLNPWLIKSGYTMIAPDQFLLQVNLLMLGIGIVIGSLGSVISMRRFLRT